MEINDTTSMMIMLLVLSICLIFLISVAKDKAESRMRKKKSRNTNIMLKGISNKDGEIEFHSHDAGVQLGDNEVAFDFKIDMKSRTVVLGKEELDTLKRARNILEVIGTEVWFKGDDDRIPELCELSKHFESAEQELCNIIFEPLNNFVVVDDEK